MKRAKHLLLHHKSTEVKTLSQKPHKTNTFIKLALISGLFLLSNIAISNVNAQSKTADLNKKESVVQKGATASEHFFTLLSSNDRKEIDEAISEIKKNWSPGLIPFALESLPYLDSFGDRLEMILLMKKVSKEDYGLDNNKWYQWLWNQDITPAPGYADFKAKLHKNIDLKFEKYFLGRQDSARIRLDEIRWGGVVQDGIPPLRNPEMITAQKATYLGDDNIVFGIEINGDARAYPKRILAWHEMFTDTIGGVDIAGVYCTLCGTVIPYKTSVNGVDYKMGTSGFLYRSNKLMYDQRTQSLWSTEEGKPVVGPLVDKGIQLPYESVVTTTWAEWKKRHPDTTVLSLKTGHRRDYDEGAAYADYFATDQLMFNTPFNDKRLANKQEILALRFQGAPNEQLAIDTDYLNENPVYSNNIGRQKFVVFTDLTGANRVYDPKDIEFKSYDQKQTATDKNGKTWRVEEEKLIGPKGKELQRLPYHRAFWFGWHAAFPDTKLIK